MPRKKILVCSNFALETRSIIESAGFSDVEVITFPSCCSDKDERDKFIAANNSEADTDDATIILSDSCPKHILSLIDSHGFKRPEAFSVKICPILFLNETLIEHYIRQGSYIITPGWLRNWRNILLKWGFDRDTAKEFFSDCIKKVVILDTGTDYNTENNAAEFAEYVDIVYEIIPTGLDHYRLLLSDMIANKELTRHKQKLPEVIAGANKLSADYAMSFDLIVALVNEQSFNTVIQRLLDFFTIMFAPGSLLFIPSVNQEHGKIQTVPRNITIGDKEKDVYLNKIETFNGSFEWTENDKGFRFLIKNREEVFGMVEINNLAFPENKEYYLNIALTISDICGLALNNANIYSKLNKTLEVLNINLNEKEKIGTHLKLVNKELEDFSYTVSHDLKNPLNFIKGYLYYIREEPALINSLIDKIIERTDSALHFINHLLTLSRAGKIIQDTEPVPLSSIIRIVFNQIKTTSSNIKLIMEQEIPFIEGDPERINHVITNIIQNFTQNRDPDKDEHILEVSYITVNDKIIIKFKDNGIGIKKEFQHRLFEPGYTLRKDGTGFGLSIIKKVMVAHRGSIKIESEGEKMGTSVYLEFPLKQ